MTEDFLLLFKNYCFFELKNLVGSGAFSQVYQAVLKDESSREIAVKCYKKNVSSAFKRAASEIAFLKILKHPNIIEYVLADLTKPCMFLGMEFSRHGSLINVLQRGPFPESFVRPIIKQIVSAVHYLQSMSICHGDIKPENIIVSQVNPDFTVKLIDFGLAEVVIKKGENRRKCGSLYYMAPELLLNLSCDLSTDLFSVGVLMHELLFSRKPFPACGNKDKHINFLKTKGKLVHKNESTTSISSHCYDLLEKFLSYNKARRPMGEALKNHPFLEIVEVKVDQDHYTEGYKCIKNSTQLASQNDYGNAYIEGMEAVIHLKVVLAAGNHDAGFLTYVESKLNEYNTFCSRLENTLIQNAKENVFIDPENLRSALNWTPNLLTGYDMCTMGAMYIEENQIAIGKKQLKDGLKLLLDGMNLEPEGNRKRLLESKINEWDQLLKEIEGRSDNN